MRSPLVRFVLVLSLGSALCASDAARADVDPEAKARYEAGVREYRAGDYSRAIADFQAADERAPNAALSFDTAQAYEKLADLPNARRFYVQYLERKPDADDRPAVETTIASIDAKLSQTSAPAPILVTGPERAPASPEATADQRRPRGHLLSEIFFGAGAAGLLTGGTLNFFASQAAAQPTVAPLTRSQIASQYGSANGLWTGALVGYGVGAALAIAGAVVYVLEDGR